MMSASEPTIAEQPDAVQRAVAKLAASAQLKSMRGVPGIKTSGGTVKRIRERHHIVAKMVAVGMPLTDIAEKTGWSLNQLNMLVNHTPAFQELIAHYQRQDTGREAVLDEYTEQLRKRMVMGEQLINDRLNEDGDEMSTNEILRLVADAADRLGFGKHSFQHTSSDFASVLEAARKRSNRMRTVNPSPPPPAGDGGALRLDSSALGSAPPLLELKAEPEAVTTPTPQATIPTRQRAQPPIVKRRSLAA